MERRLTNKASHYVSTFKTDMKEKIMETPMSEEVRQDLVKFLYDYNGLVFTREDLVKRKRVKNIVPLYERCCAKRANDEQCTRRKKSGNEYCGTHLKGTPNGIMDASSTENISTTHRVEVWAQEIAGITYYIDSGGNVYEAEDIVMNKTNPKIVAHYVKRDDGTYSIPSYEI